MAKIKGFVAPGYESVKDVFSKHFEDGKETNAQCCAYVGEEKVVDLYGSFEEGTIEGRKMSYSGPSELPYDADSLQNVYSSTKSLAAIAMAMLVDKKLVKYTDKISDYWPEFAQLGGGGKSELTLAEVLRHEAGMATFSQTIKLADIAVDGIKNNAIGKVIEEEPLKFPKNTTREYHALTRGWILNEIFRRVEPEGRTIGEFIRSEVSLPFQADVHIGLKESDLCRSCDVTARSSSKVALEACRPKCLGGKAEGNIVETIAAIYMFSMKPANPRPVALETFVEGEGMPAFVQHCNDREFKMGEMPSANGQCSARGLAKIAAVMANKGQLEGKRLLSEETWEMMHGEEVRKRDQLFRGKTNFTQGGVAKFELSPDDGRNRLTLTTLLREGYYGWMGLGGSVFQWHPGFQIGFSYAPSLIAWSDFANTKAARLQKEVTDCAKKIQAGNEQ